MADAVQLPSNALHIVDPTSGTRYLVDTGACVSLFPATQDQRDPDPDPIQLTAANGQPIQTFGFVLKTISIAGQQYAWQFRLATVTQPLIGADFLIHHKLIVDMAGRVIIPATAALAPRSNKTGTRLRGTGSACVNSCSTNSSSGSSDSSYARLRHEFSDIFRPELKLKASSEHKHNVFHHIDTTGPPQYSRYRRLNPQKLAAAKQAFSDMERMGVCEKAASPWASPLHMVRKSDKTWRPCGDYRRLNNVTTPDKYPMPHIADITNVLGSSRVFSKLDLLKAYFQVPVHPPDRPKTAIITPFGSYIFKYSTFGLRNSGATFQRLMDMIFGEYPNVVVYIDDILVFSDNHDDHAKHLRDIFQLCRENGLVLHSNKCVLGAPEVEFLSHNVSSAGIIPPDHKVKAVKDFPTPTDIKSLQRFLGMVNYFRRFIHKHSEIAEPLVQVIRDKKFSWGSDQQTAFRDLKNSLATATHLAYPSNGDQLVLTTDASKVAIGSVLEAVNHRGKRPLAFFSRTLTKTERRYSAFDRELLAIHASIRHFRHMVCGSHFTVFTDHKPIITALHKTGDPWSDRQRAHLSAISESGAEVQYTKGTDNVVADALSRAVSPIQTGYDTTGNSVNPVQLTNRDLLTPASTDINYDEMAAHQQADPEIKQYRTATTSLQLRDVEMDGTSLLCDVSTGRARPLVPASMRRKVVSAIHNLAHPSIASTVKLVSDRFVWHKMKRDIRQWARTCEKCQCNKVYRHTQPPLGQFNEPLRRFSHIHVDITGPLPTSGGMRYIFTIVNRSTRWCEATPIPDQSSQSCITALAVAWISRFGVPKDITSDQGACFTSALWTNFAKVIGAQLHHTTSYHPASNGLVERFHRDLKAALRARCTDNNWIIQLPWVLLGLRTITKDATNASPAEIVYGQPLAVPGDFWPAQNPSDEQTRRELDAARHTAENFRPTPPKDHGHPQVYIPSDLKSAKYVFLRDDRIKPALAPPYTGPYLVLKRSPNAYQLQMGTAQKWHSLERLKPAFIEDRSSSRSGRNLS